MAKPHNIRWVWAYRRIVSLWRNDDLTPAGFRWCFLATYSENDNPIVVVVAKEGLPDNNLYEITASGEEVLRRDNYSLAPSLQVNIYPKWFEAFGEKLAMHLTWEQKLSLLGLVTEPYQWA